MLRARGKASPTSRRASRFTPIIVAPTTATITPAAHVLLLPVLVRRVQRAEPMGNAQAHFATSPKIRLAVSALICRKLEQPVITLEIAVATWFAPYPHPLQVVPAPIWLQVEARASLVACPAKRVSLASVKI